MDKLIVLSIRFSNILQLSFSLCPSASSAFLSVSICFESLLERFALEAEALFLSGVPPPLMQFVSK
jgi:hypothetical protein